MFSKRVQTLLSSPTIAIDVKAKDFIRQGIPVINLSVGEPNFQTPENIKKAAHVAIDKGFSFYTTPEGILELREAIAKKLTRDNKLSYDPSEIIVGSGSKQLLYTAFQVLCDKGDEVIIPVPTWNTFVEQVKLAEGKPVLITLKSPFKLTAKAVKKAITPKTKILLINSPSNPTGMIIDSEELKKIADLIVKKDLLVIADEIYEKLIYTKEYNSIASLNVQIKQRTVTINGVSKAYAMTGWRIGYAVGPKEIIAKMKALQSQLLSHPTSIAQVAAVEALNGDQKSVESMRKAFVKRREFCIKELSKIKGLSFIKPEGAFYLFISIEKLLGKAYPTATTWAAALLEKEKVAVVPGEAFFYPGYIRLSYAASDKNLQEAMKRIKKFIEK
ncbi:MAG TPA: pyridoxal phosphate-dependent aminotransferase [Candidatus Sulfotelmatobacter sp.]|jgi:aspartate aminotransferase|nr:pyridoxal phosphate-dependent aminotransferase [Candidatus Sulfotelmatobacter sp.]